MDMTEQTPEPTDARDERDTVWSEMNERLKALQEKYARALVGAEPRPFATRFRG